MRSTPGQAHPEYYSLGEPRLLGDRKVLRYRRGTVVNPGFLSIRIDTSPAALDSGRCALRVIIEAALSVERIA